MYTNRYQYRKPQATPQNSLKSKIVMGVGILLIAILCNYIVELPLYHNLIVALS